MKTDNVKQKIEQFTNGLDANGATYVVIVNDRKGNDQFHIFLNGTKRNLLDMMFETFKEIARVSDMPLASVLRLMAAVVEKNGENYGC